MDFGASFGLEMDSEAFLADDRYLAVVGGLNFGDGDVPTHHPIVDAPGIDGANDLGVHKDALTTPVVNASPPAQPSGPV